jgi:cytochrome b involved in lipid metabolism
LKLAGYLHSHPGGAQILHEYAGRDATDEFSHAHADWVQKLRNHRDLVVGRMIDKITDISHIEDDEVVLLGRVYDFSSP